MKKLAKLLLATGFVFASVLLPAIGLSHTASAASSITAYFIWNNDGEIASHKFDDLQGTLTTAESGMLAVQIAVYDEAEETVGSPDTGFETIAKVEPEVVEASTNAAATSLVVVLAVTAAVLAAGFFAARALAKRRVEK